MNPVLLKPQSEIGAQVVVQGRVIGNAKAARVPSHEAAAVGGRAATASRGCAPRRTSFSSRGRARRRRSICAAATSPTWALRAPPTCRSCSSATSTAAASSPASSGRRRCWSPRTRALIEGFIVNKFRGDPALFDEGMRALRDADRLARISDWCRISRAMRAGCRPRMRWRSRRSRAKSASARVRIVVLAYPRISNFDDFDPLRLEPNVEVEFLAPGEPIPADADLVILPGSKATIADLAALRCRGLGHRSQGPRAPRRHACSASAAAIRCWVAHCRPRRHRRPAATSKGWGMLDVETQLPATSCWSKCPATGSAAGTAFQGLRDARRPYGGPRLRNGRCSDSRTGAYDGAASADGRVAGCYIHGLFADDRAAQLLAGTPGAGALVPELRALSRDGRSTSWRSIWSATSIAMRCSQQRARRASHSTSMSASAATTRGLQHASHAIERAARAGCRRLRASARPSPIQ